VVELRMIGDRSSELAQSVTDLIVFLLFCSLSLSETLVRVEICLHRSFVPFWFHGHNHRSVAQRVPRYCLQAGTLQNLSDFFASRIRFICLVIENV
jgi:hypothetical protein